MSCATKFNLLHTVPPQSKVFPTPLLTVDYSYKIFWERGGITASLESKAGKVYTLSSDILLLYVYRLVSSYTKAI